MPIRNKKHNMQHKDQQKQKLESDLSELQADIHVYMVHTEGLNKDSQFKVYIIIYLYMHNNILLVKQEESYKKYLFHVR